MKPDTVKGVSAIDEQCQKLYIAKEFTGEINVVDARDGDGCADDGTDPVDIRVRSPRKDKTSNREAVEHVIEVSVTYT
jgi:hypothetical protein